MTISHAQNPSAQSLDRQIDGQGILPSVLSFEGAELKIIDRDGRPWLAAADLARALGYARADKVTQIYERHASEFSDDMTGTLKLRVKGFGSGDSEKPVRIFSPRGCHLVAMFSRTERAAAFRRWVLDVLEQYEASEPIDEASVRRTLLAELQQQVYQTHSPVYLAAVEQRARELLAERQEQPLRDLRLLVSWDYSGQPQVQVLPSSAVVIPPDQLAGYVGDMFGPALTTLPDIIEAAAKRLGAAVCLPHLREKH